MLAFRGFAGEAAPRLVETNIPDVGNRDVLVRIKACGLNLGTFTLFRAGMLKPLPMTFGHEGAGIVEKVGRDVERFRPGDRVRIHPTLSCGRCRHCLTDRDQMCSGSAMMGFVSFGRTVPDYEAYHDGFLAHFALAPEKQVDRLPDHVSFDAGAKLHSLANAWRNLRVAGLPPAGVLGIFGATGTMGVSTIRIARLFGVSRLLLFGRSTDRLVAVRRLAAVPTEIVATDALGERWAETGALSARVSELAPDGMDAVIDYLPEGGPIWQALNGLATGGTIVSMGGSPQPLPLPLRALVGKCWKVAGTRNHSRSDARDVLRLLGEGSLIVDDLVTHRHSLDQIDAAVASLEARDGNAWMSVINP